MKLQIRKRFLAAVLALGVTLPLMSCTEQLADANVKAAQPVQEINAMNQSENKIHNGNDPAGLRTLDRLGFLQLLARASGEDMEKYENTSCPFNDTDDPAVSWAYAKWLVHPNENGRFRPEDAITRQEAAAILGRYLDYQYTDLPAGCGTGAPRMDDIAEWAQKGVMQCWMYGVIDTGDALDFHPQGLMTGAYGQELAENAAHLEEKALGAYPGKAEEQTFADALVEKADPSGNFMLSPYSARLCLAMLANGAAGQTRQEMLDALRIENLDAFNEQVRQQMQTYDSYARIMSLDTANSIWLNQSRFDGKGAFLPQFRQSMQTYYHADAQEVTDSDSVEKINAWVKEKTSGKIPSIMTEEQRQFAAALVNAVYFKAAWQQEFFEENTQKADFTNADGTKTQVDMMRQTNSFGYFSTPGLEALRMDYQNAAFDENGENFEWFENADFSMYFIKAKEKVDIQNLLDQISFTNCDVRVSIPKFHIEYSQPLEETLQALGVRLAFEPDLAELTNLIDPSSAPGQDFYLDAAIQKTYIDIDEKGTEAAAATAMFVDCKAALIDREPLVREFTADSPFWFAVRDNASKEILFVGRCDSFN